MKLLGFIFLAAFFANSYADEPQCIDGHWVSDDFVLFTGGENCQDRVITCNYESSKTEGWYSYPRREQVSLTIEQCNDFDRKPECVELMSGKQGWVTRDNKFIADKCSGMDVVCLYKGTDQEGFYAYPAQERHMVSKTPCFNN